MAQAVADDGGGLVELADLGALGVELEVLVVEGLAEGLAALGTFGGGLLAQLELLGELLVGRGVGDTEGVEDGLVLAGEVVGAGDDLLGDRRALHRVGLQEVLPGLALEHGGQLPRQVVGP